MSTSLDRYHPAAGEKPVGQISPLTYRINDFCNAVGISRSSTYDLVKSGKLKTIKIAGRTLIPASEAQRLIQEAS